MRYKKDMLLILAAVLILGITIQAARTDLILTLAEGKGISEKRKPHHTVQIDKQTGVDEGKQGKIVIQYVSYVRETEKQE